MEKRMARFIQGDRPEAGAELVMPGWKLARLFLGVAVLGRASRNMRLNSSAAQSKVAALVWASGRRRLRGSLGGPPHLSCSGTVAVKVEP